MRFLPWLTRDNADSEHDDIDVGRLLAQGLADRSSARNARRELARYRTYLVRRRKILEKPLNQLNPANVRRMASSGASMGSLQMTHEMRIRDAHTVDAGRMMQVAEVQRQIDEVDAALQELKTIRRRA
jgi:hypothetical protein